MMDLLSFPENARVWIYAGDKQVPEEITGDIYNKILAFTKEWSSHQQALKATGGLLHNYFVVFVVDDGYNKPGGCSIDSSVRFIRNLGTELNIDFFNRNIFYYLQDEKVKAIRREDLHQAIEDKQINDNTLFFDNLVQTKSQFQKEWLKEFKDSWQKKLI
jgi:hypothetical protein